MTVANTILEERAKLLVQDFYEEMHTFFDLKEIPKLPLIKRAIISVDGRACKKSNEIIIRDDLSEERLDITVYHEGGHLLNTTGLGSANTDMAQNIIPSEIIAETAAYAMCLEKGENIDSIEKRANSLWFCEVVPELLRELQRNNDSQNPKALVLSMRRMTLPGLRRFLLDKLQRDYVYKTSKEDPYGNREMVFGSITGIYR